MAWTMKHVLLMSLLRFLTEVLESTEFVITNVHVCYRKCSNRSKVYLYHTNINFSTHDVLYWYIETPLNQYNDYVGLYMCVYIQIPCGVSFDSSTCTYMYMYKSKSSGHGGCTHNQLVEGFNVKNKLNYINYITW